MRFNDKVVAITGAAQGIGRQTAIQAAQEGARLLLIDRSRHVHELAATLVSGGGQVLALKAEPGTMGKHRTGFCRRRRAFWTTGRAGQ